MHQQVNETLFIWCHSQSPKKFPYTRASLAAKSCHSIVFSTRTMSLSWLAPYKLCIALQSYQLWCARLAASACQWEYQDKLLPARQLDSDAVAGRKTGGFCQTCQHCHHLSYLSNLLSNHETKDILTEISMFKINLISKCVLSFQKMFGLYERSLTDKQEKMELLSL